ncbi:MAG: hypothetical protein PUE81_10455 [Lachnospiraceae bacterium]|nr:hypothetical protein [Lachnospiraceae bacterium]
MKKKVIAALLCGTMVATLFAGCGKEKAPQESQTPEPESQAPVEEVGAEALPDAFAHITFDEGAGEAYKAIVQVDDKGDNDGANFGLADTDATFQYVTGPVGNALYLDGSYGLDLGLEATNTDTYTVSFWVNADRLATYGPTLQFGYNIGKAADAGNNVSWANVTQTEWGTDGAKIFPIVWSRNEASDAAADIDCWPWLYSFDDSIHGKREWAMVTIVCSGEEQTGPTGNKTVGAQLYVNGQLTYDSQDNYANGSVFEYTWDATLAPNLMKPDGSKFESYFGINYWDTVFKGFVDDLYVFDSALTAGQVLSLYQLGDATVETVAPDGGSEEETAADVTITGTAVGTPDCATGFWGAHSETWAVPEGESVSKTFINYHGAEAANWNNFVVVLQNVADAHSADDNADYKEYGVVRADNYGWAGEANTGTEGALPWVLESNWNWDSFAADLQGATVTVTVTNNGGSADVVADVTTAAGATYQQKYSGIVVDGDLFFCLTVDNCCLDIQN